MLYYATLHLKSAYVIANGKQATCGGAFALWYGDAHTIASSSFSYNGDKGVRNQSRNHENPDLNPPDPQIYISCPVWVPSALWGGRSTSKNQATASEA